MKAFWTGLFGLWGTLCGGAPVPVSTPEELRAAMKGAVPGDEIVLASGEWRDAELRIRGRGTAAAPIVVRAAEPGKTVITGASRLRLSGEHVVVSGLWFRNVSGANQDWLEFREDSKNRARHCRVTECAFTQDEDFEVAEKENRWIGLYGEGNELDRCYIAGKRNGGAAVVVWLGDGDAGRHRIHRNHFGPRPELGRNGGETLRVGDSATSMMNAGCVVEENLFDRCDGETECISNKSGGNVYRGNTFRAVSGTLTLRHGNDCLVESNVFIGDGARRTGGVRVVGEGHRILNNQFIGLTGEGFRSALVLVNGIPNSPANGYLPVRNIEVIDNEFLHCKHPMLLGYNDVKEATVAPDGVLFRGNRIVSEDEASAIEVGLMPARLRWENNEVHAERLGIEEQKGLRRMDEGGIRITPRGALEPKDVGPRWRS